MNSCILMATIVRDPELRSTQDQVSVSSMLVEFPSTREQDPPGTLKVEGWGNLAEEMKKSYNVGDNIIIEGRLSMNLLERDGYKEKRATLVASRIYPVGVSNTDTSANFVDDRGYPKSNPQSDNVVDFASSMQTQPATADYEPAPTEASDPAPANDTSEDWDEIPF